MTEAYTRTWGIGDPVIALHPLGPESSAFAGVGSVLARRGYRTIAVDLPGFGRTPASERPPTPAVLAEPVIALARVLSPPPVLVGLSMGGRVALEVALTAPEAVRAVIPIAPYLPWRRFRALLHGARLIDARLAGLLPLEHAWPLLRSLATLLEALPYLRDDEVAQAGMRFVYYLACPATRATFFAAAREMALDPAFGPDGFWTRLAALPVRAAFVWGERDRLVTPRFASGVARTLPGAPQRVLPCAGHWWNGPHHVCLAELVADLVTELAEGRPVAERATADDLRCRVRRPDPREEWFAPDVWAAVRRAFGD